MTAAADPTGFLAPPPDLGRNRTGAGFRRRYVAAAPVARILPLVFMLRTAQGALLTRVGANICGRESERQRKCYSRQRRTEGVLVLSQ